MRKAFVCLGSNLGDASGQLARAAEKIGSFPGVQIGAASSVYRTEPQGRKDQPWFLNQVLELHCSDSVTSLMLLDNMLRQEKAMGRVRDGNDRFGPRVIDMDLLLFGSEERKDDEHLILPHPRMEQRAFVLVPLLEIAPDLLMPDGRTVRALLEKLDYRLEGSAIFQ